MRPEHDVAGESPRLADQHLWSAEDENASEWEIQSFLWGVIRAIKPRLVVETGCYHGDATVSMASAISANGVGEIIVCDSDPENAEKTRIRLRFANDFREFGTELKVDVRTCKSFFLRDMISRCDLLFADSSTEARMQEVSWLKPGAIAVVHDTYSHPELGEFVKSMGGILFDTPRGFGIIRK